MTTCYLLLVRWVEFNPSQKNISLKLDHQNFNFRDEQKKHLKPPAIVIIVSNPWMTILNPGTSVGTDPLKSHKLHIHIQGANRTGRFGLFIPS